MKLTPAQVERTMSQIEAQPVPDNDPLAWQLNELFGEHTFFLDDNGLNIVEVATRGGAGPARVINLASWADSKLNSLLPHEPEPTGAILDLGTKH